MLDDDHRYSAQKPMKHHQRHCSDDVHRGVLTGWVELSAICCQHIAIAGQGAQLAGDCFRGAETALVESHLEGTHQAAVQDYMGHHVVRTCLDRSWRCSGALQRRYSAQCEAEGWLTGDSEENRSQSHL